MAEKQPCANATSFTHTPISFQYPDFVTMRFTIDECPAVTSYSPTKTLELNGTLLAMR